MFVLAATDPHSAEQIVTHSACLLLVKCFSSLTAETHDLQETRENQNQHQPPNKTQAAQCWLEVCLTSLINLTNQMLNVVTDCGFSSTAVARRQK